MKGLTYLMLLSVIVLICKTDTKAQTPKSRTLKKTIIVKNQPKRFSSKTVVYKKPKKKVLTVRSLPNRTVIKHKGISYHYSNNKFYTYSGGRYIVIAPQIGFRINKLPVGYRIIEHHQRNYFWADGIFYIKTAKEYEVVEPEVGTVIYELPGDYERVEIDGKVYYEFSNVLYEKIQQNHTRAYEVVGFIEQ